jgi:lipoprotein-releasing system permease protein
VLRPVSATIGFRYARSRRSFISFISTVAVAGLVLSVAVLLLVTSIMNGFERELRERVLGILPHITIQGRTPLHDWPALARQVEAVPGVLGAAPFVQGSGLLAVDGQSAGVLVTGIDPVHHPRVSDLARFVDGADLTLLRAGTFDVLLGSGVAARLGIGVGDRVTLVLPEASVTIAGIVPRQRQVTVAGIVRSGSDLDARAIYLHLDDAARLFRLGDRVHGLHLRLQNLFAATDVGNELLALTARESFFVITWMRSHGNLYQAIGFQRATMFLLLSLLVAVAAFNLVSSLIMVVNQRRGDIAILRTLGAGGGTIVFSFVVLGGLVGLAGIGMGVLLGIGASLLVQDGYLWLERKFELQLMTQYFVNYLPSEIRVGDVLLVTAVAFGLCILSTLYPALRAAGLRPAEVLRHE